MIPIRQFSDKIENDNLNQFLDQQNPYNAIFMPQYNGSNELDQDLGMSNIIGQPSSWTTRNLSQCKTQTNSSDRNTSNSS